MQLHHRLNHQSEYSLLLPNFMPTSFQAFRLSLVAKLHILFEMSCSWEFFGRNWQSSGMNLLSHEIGI